MLLIRIVMFLAVVCNRVCKWSIEDCVYARTYFDNRSQHASALDLQISYVKWMLKEANMPNSIIAT